MLKLCDIVLLDYKYTNDADYQEKCGCSISKVDHFLTRLDEMNKRVWLRQVIIPGLNDSDESVERLYALRKRFGCIEKIELLPFRKLCIEKYKTMGIKFPLADTPEADPCEVETLARRMENKNV